MFSSRVADFVGFSRLVDARQAVVRCVLNVQAEVGVAGSGHETRAQSGVTMRTAIVTTVLQMLGGAVRSILLRTPLASAASASSGHMFARWAAGTALAVAFLAFLAAPAGADSGVIVTCPGPVFFGSVQLPDITNGQPECLVTVPGASVTTGGKLEATAPLNPGTSDGSTFTYDQEGNLLRIGQETIVLFLEGDPDRPLSTVGSTSFVYDASGRVISTTGPVGTTSFTYNAAGELSDVTAPGGQVTSFAYDQSGHLTNAGGVEFTYNTDGGLVSGGGYTFVYDPNGRVIQIVDPQGSTTPVSYNTGGGINSFDGTSFVYDSESKLIQLANPTSGTVNFSYGSGGGLIQSGTTTYVYDSLGRLISTTDPLAGTTNFGYGGGLLTSVGEPDGTVVPITWVVGTQPDITPPTISASATSEGSPYTGGTWTRFPVVVHYTCVDNPGGSGVATVTGDQTVSTQGANQAATGTCADSAGNTASVTFGGIDIDDTPPAVTASDVSATASGPSGVAVGSYPVSATDNLDPSPVVICVPPAPYTFPIGDTSVSCTATDQAGNVSAPASFTVHVLGASAQLAMLRTELGALTLATGLATDLGTHLDLATSALAAGQPDQAVQQLGVFSSRIGQELQSKRPAISTSDGQNLIADADKIDAVLGVRPQFVATRVVHGDFNGDGRTDIAEFDAATGVWLVGLSKGSKFSLSTWATWSSAVTWTDIRVGDFNGDGKADIAGRVVSSGQWWVGLSNGGSFSTTLWATWSTGVSWVDVQVGDFNGDGKAEIAGRALSNGQWWVATSNGSSFSTTLWATWSSSVSWVGAQVGDFNGDGSSDIAALDSSAGNWWVAQSTGSAFVNALWSGP